MDIKRYFFSLHILDAVGNICRKPMKADAAAGKDPIWNGFFK